MKIVSVEYFECAAGTVSDKRCWQRNSPWLNLYCFFQACLNKLLPHVAHAGCYLTYLCYADPDFG